jgi:hypothetical protein
VSIRSIVIPAVLGALVTGGCLPASAQTKAVIELFTSQGCSSCPPADKLMAQYADRSDILALSFNVDYWDMLGWKDTLASPDNTARQRDYSLARGDGQVYTPQAVIDGRVHAVGSNRSAIEAAIAANPGALSVPLSMTSSTDAVTVNIGAAPGGTAPHATLWLVMYDRSVTVPIEHGENSGKSVTYNNVVRKLRPIAMWKGEPMSVDLPKSEMEHARTDRCAVLLQAEKEGGLPGPILGATAISASW